MELKNKGRFTISVLTLVILVFLMLARYGILEHVMPGYIRAHIVGDVSLGLILIPPFVILLTVLYKRNREIRGLNEELCGKTSDLILSNEKERRKIALALHDRIGQNLALSRKKIVQIADTFPEPGEAVIESAVALIDQTISDMRSLNFEISPHILYDEGLEAALDWLCEQMQKDSGLTIEFEDDLMLKPLTPDSRILLYRCARELLMNAVKHSEGSRVRVRMSREKNSIRIDVRDNGMGLKPGWMENKSYGFGLSSVFGQVRYHGGEVLVQSDPGEGARFAIIYPLDGQFG